MFELRPPARRSRSRPDLGWYGIHPLRKFHHSRPDLAVRVIRWVADDLPVPHAVEGPPGGSRHGRLAGFFRGGEKMAVPRSRSAASRRSERAADCRTPGERLLPKQLPNSVARSGTRRDGEHFGGRKSQPFRGYPGHGWYAARRLHAIKRIATDHSPAHPKFLEWSTASRPRQARIRCFTRAMPGLQGAADEVFVCGDLPTPKAGHGSRSAIVCLSEEVTRPRASRAAYWPNLG